MLKLNVFTQTFNHVHCNWSVFHFLHYDDNVIPRYINKELNDERYKLMSIQLDLNMIWKKLMSDLNKMCLLSIQIYEESVVRAYCINGIYCIKYVTN